VLHTFAFTAIPKNLSRFSVGKFNLEGEASAKLNLVEEELDRIGSGHSQRGKDLFRLSFDGGRDPGPDSGGFQHASIVAHL